MSTFHIYKYQGAGNDFVILDNRDGAYKNISQSEISFLCNRRFGVGADGLMLLQKSEKYDFSMIYFNSDGNESSMCGNGGRCLVAFAAHRGIKKFDFEAIDGFHSAQILDYSQHRCIVKLKMSNVAQYSKHSNDSYFLDTGSPHYVKFVQDLDNYPVLEKGKYWRSHSHFNGGTNANFVEIISDDTIKVRTFERGVEDETLACGTGVTAAAISTFLHTNKTTPSSQYNIIALGDKLNVTFDYRKSDNTFSEIFLTGPATFVFESDIAINI